MTVWHGLLIGFFIGGSAGMLTMGLLAAAGRDNGEEERQCGK